MALFANFGGAKLMNIIPSFDVDHTQLLAGLYVSRKDKIGEMVITTFDVRLVSPYKEVPVSAAVLHTLEHLVATYLRGNTDWKERIVYWGPMGCQTGFYFLVEGDYSSRDVQPLLKAGFDFVVNFEGCIPGTKDASECGNFELHDLFGAQELAKKYVTVLENLSDSNTIYPTK